MSEVSAAAEPEDVEVEATLRPRNLREFIGQPRVREQLEDALGRDGGQAPLWRLQTNIEQSRRPLGRRIDDTAARYELMQIYAETGMNRQLDAFAHETIAIMPGDAVATRFLGFSSDERVLGL